MVHMQSWKMTNEMKMKMEKTNRLSKAIYTNMSIQDVSKKVTCLFVDVLLVGNIDQIHTQVGERQTKLQAHSPQEV